MIDKSLSPALLEFIRRHVDSVETLEVLLLLFKEKDRAYSAEQISDALRSTRASIEQRLVRLTGAGLVRRDEASPPTYVVSSFEGGQESVIGELAARYSRFRIRIIEAIYSPQADALHAFANAFKLRSDDDDHG